MWLRKLTDPIGRAILHLLADEDVDAERRIDLTDRADEVTENFLKYFSARTRTYTCIVIAVLALLLILDAAICVPIPGQIYGLSVDICGAVVLGRGLVKGPYAIAAEAGTYYDLSRPRMRSLILDLADGIWGIFLLILGVVLQIVAVSGLFLTISLDCVI